jgi:hypothetical protein
MIGSPVLIDDQQQRFPRWWEETWPGPPQTEQPTIGMN